MAGAVFYRRPIYAGYGEEFKRYTRQNAEIECDRTDLCHFAICAFILCAG